MKKSPKPQPVVVNTICSLCDQSWEAHGDNPTTDDCIRLLKAALAVRPPHYYWYSTPTIWTGSSTSGFNATGSTAYTVTFNTPDDGEPPAAVAAA